MLTIIIVLVLTIALTFFLMKKGKITDVNNNNIPDIIETKVEVIKEVVKEEVKKTKQSATKKPAGKQSSISTKKIIKKEK